jgi:hypothetical protein
MTTTHEAHTHVHDEHQAASGPRFVVKDKDINDEIVWAPINEDVLRSPERLGPLYWVVFFASLGLFRWGLYGRSSQ